jgi:flavorubredoxin
MARTIGPDLYQIQQCIPKPMMSNRLRDDPPDWYDPAKTIHVCNNAYLFDGDRTLLYDTLSPGARGQLLEELDHLLGDSGLDYVVPSHPEAPHAGNTNAVLRAYPDAELLSSAYGRGEELYYLDRGRKVEAGETLDLGGPEIEFITATFPDTAFHIWVHDRTTGALCSADWLGTPHVDGECGLFADELDHDLSAAQICEFQANGLRWLQYSDQAAVERAIDDLIETYEPEVVCPAHGLAIREDVEALRERMTDVLEYIVEHGEIAELA